MPEITPAQELRDAAKAMRHEQDSRGEFWTALADWLDTEAQRCEDAGTWALDSVSPGLLAIARAYLHGGG